MHGASLAIHKGWMAWDPLARFKGNSIFDAIWSLFSRLLTLGLVLLGWIFFRAESWGVATQYLSRLLSWSHDGTRLLSPYILPAVAGVFLVHLFVNKDRQWAHEMPLQSVWPRILAYSGLALLLTCLAATDSAPFIYFQF